MKKLLALTLILIISFTLAACSNKSSTQQEIKSNNQTKLDTTTKKILVVYFSRVGTSSFSKDVDVVTSASLRTGDKGLIGNTEVIADMVKEAVGGELFQIVTVKPYPGDYNETTDVALKEQKDGARPELATHIENMKDYDVILLGYPNWWGTLPMPVFTFLQEYDFSGKTIVPFVTHDGSALGKSVDDIKKLAPQSTVLKGLAIRYKDVENAQKDVSKWLRELGMIK